MIHFREVRGKSLEKVYNGAYYRCFGNVEVAQLLSRVQSLIIKNGYELENIVKDLTSDRQIEDLDDFLSNQIMPSGTLVVLKKEIKSSCTIQGHGIEPDFMVFQRIASSQTCYVIELKDGHEFDTKSSAKEHANLHQFITMNSEPLHYFQVYAKIVGFNANTQEEIQIGFKNKIALEQAMTGRDFCSLIEIDYDSILESRASDREDNLNILVDDLLKITELHNRLKSLISGESSI